MRLLLDENLSQRIIATIVDIYEVKHIKDFNLAQASDDTIWEFAKLNDYIIVSKDSDFHQRSLLWGHPPKLIYLKMGNCKTVDITRVLIDNYAIIKQFSESEYEDILVLM